jgi:RNA polymerase sigma-54 factor
MPLELKQQLKLTQQLVMTPQLQQAIRLLQLTRMELTDVVREEMMENPLLEDAADTDGERAKEREEFDAGGRSEATLAAVGETELAPAVAPEREAEVKLGDHAVNEIDWANYLEDHAAAPPMPAYRSNNEDLPSLEATLSKRTSLFEHLVEQLNLTSMGEDDRAIGMLILGNLDDDGYLRAPPLDELAADARGTQEEAERVLRQVQRFDPVGVAARTLKECLLVQVETDGADDLVIRIIEGHLDNLEKKNYQAIARDLKEPIEEIYEAVKVIVELDPRPGRIYSSDEPRYVTPDVYVHRVGDKYFVVINDDGLPKLKISATYRRTFAGASPEARDYVQDRLRSAQWLIRSIQQRQRTIVKVTESILKFQAEFFEKGISHLKPLILRDVAEDISMHESTVSRVTSNKYVHTAQGIFELKFFFSPGISRTYGEEVASQAVKSSIKTIIAAENPRHPFSDQRIVELLLAQNVDIARRTVAKYREQLGVLSSSKRKQVF